MREHVTVHSLANHARMLRTRADLSVVLVEGDSDVKLMRAFIDERRCKVIWGNGKPTVMGAMKEVRRTRHSGILAIVDADFWHLEGTCPKDARILTTDTHDAETMMLKSQALDHLLATHAWAGKVGKLGKDIRRALLDAAIPVGHLRWVAEPNRLGLSLAFSSVNYRDFTNTERLTTDVGRLVSEVLLRNPTCRMGFRELVESIGAAIGVDHDPWQVCCGHDMTEILALGLNDNFGRKRDLWSRKSVEKELRSHFRQEFFKSTRLYARLVVWERNNKPLRVLAE